MADAAELVRRARQETTGNRFLELLEAGEVPRERLAWLAGEQYNIIWSDRRSFATFAARFPAPPAGDMFLDLSHGEGEALKLLPAFAEAVCAPDMADDLAAYEPRPLAQAYPAYLAQRALFGSVSGTALAMLANLAEWGSYCGRTADALIARYGLSEAAVAFFRFFAATPPGFEEQATAVVQQGLDAGESEDEALRTARALHAYEAAFWDTLAEGL